nr:STE20-like serine/threonine-protein kinase [Biomphalaria glabrata]
MGQPIPHSAKVRKLSTSAKSTWSALTSKSVIKTVDPAIQDSSRVSPQVYTSSLPKFLREVFSYLWCDNPDRDPFNTFSVSETELTSAIAHLEQQLSTRVSNPEQKSRASLFSALLPQSSSAPSSPKHVAPDFRANDYCQETFDQELDMLTKQQKQQIEKAEQLQQNDMKNASKKIKAEAGKLHKCWCLDKMFSEF